MKYCIYLSEGQDGVDQQVWHESSVVALQEPLDGADVLGPAGYGPDHDAAGVVERPHQDLQAVLGLVTGDVEAAAAGHEATVNDACENQF